ncbi:BA75_04577T0 [Komagataella pastoris]|uniref:NADH-cytochrome b5 reductase n=1 Tax=Komagataella pastoris TaxID=4922 RepID=A0A1B2JJ27_PICPA|nr:BA75_04577T0 [Komagataella pastoris]
MFAKISSSRYFIPTVAATAAAIGSTYFLSTRNFALNESPRAFVGDDKWIDLQLIKAEDLTHDTKRLFFKLPEKDQVSGLEVASLLLAKFVTPKGSNVIRPYTPVSDVNEKGVVEFVIKRYETGKMGNHIFNLKPNDTLAFKGPLQKWKWQPNQFKEIALIGGGSGITPLYQLIHHITSNPEDNTKVKLFYGNKTPNDILLRKELEETAAKNPQQFELHLFLDKDADQVPSASSGFISKEVLQKNLPGPTNDSHVFVCGPPPLYKAISGEKVSPQDQGEVTGALADLGYDKTHVFKF